MSGAVKLTRAPFVTAVVPRADAHVIGPIGLRVSTFLPMLSLLKLHLRASFPEIPPPFHKKREREREREGDSGPSDHDTGNLQMKAEG